MRLWQLGRLAVEFASTPENFVDVVALARRAIGLQPDYGPAQAILSAALGFGSYTAVSRAP